MHGLLVLYLTGVFLYWLFYLIVVGLNWLSSFSIHAKNISGIGLETNLLTSELQEISNRPTLIVQIFTIIGVVLFSLLSWLALCIDGFLVLKRIIIAVINQKPKELKDMEWKLRNYLFKPEDVARFDLQARELMLKRKLTKEEIEALQNQLIDRGVNMDLIKELNRK